MPQAITEESVKFTSTRMPEDVLRMINVLATLDGKSIGDFNNTDLRDWVTKKFRARMSKEGRDIGGESGN